MDVVRPALRPYRRGSRPHAGGQAGIRRRCGCCQCQDPVDEVDHEAYEAGIRIFGENKVQELVEKADEVAEIADLRWALIGHLQSNKANQAAAVAAEFHALDSIKVAAALNRRLQDLGRSLDVFIQVNSSAEPQKFGLAPEDVEQFVMLPFGIEGDDTCSALC